ncbi:hypothetical protein CN601_07370 [Bacillus sp. AFS017336]|nr:hypothetical protein CN601_07370 [Bacillus sp. AFS017336]
MVNLNNKFFHYFHLNAFEFFIILLITLLIFSYLLAATNNKKNDWPKTRSILWVTGMLCILVSVIGPIANLSHHLFVFHMIMHLLLGMLAPFFIALSRPITLLLISLPIKHARRLSRVLRSTPVQLLTNPVSTLILNIGGLWVLYTSQAFYLIHNNLTLLVLLHIHLFLAGYLFTTSIISIEPTSHKYSFIFRSLIMVIALAGHDILSKLLFSNGLDHSFYDVQSGAVLMYYGGDFIDLLIIIVLCFNWYKATAFTKQMS